MTHGERKMAMPTWPVRFDEIPAKVTSAPLLGEHTAEVLHDWLGPRRGGRDSFAR